MTQRVVIGTGPDGLRAAAVLAARGESVVLLQQGSGPSGLARPDLPEGDGSYRVPVGVEARAMEAVLGPVREVPAPRLHVAMAGEVEALPLRPDRVGGLLPPSLRRPAARSWLRARGRNALAELVGGGQEERTVRDWVVRRMGAPAYESLYADYARRRFGLDAAQLGVGLARRHHAIPDDRPRVVPAGAAADALGLLADAVRRTGDIREGVQVEGFHVEDGRVRAVRLADGDAVDVENGVWVEDSPQRAVGWLGDAASPGLRVDSGRLPAFDRVRVALRGLSLEAGHVVHLLATGGPAWRVVGCGGGLAVADCTLPDGAELEDGLARRVASQVTAAGVGAADPAPGGIEHERAGEPIWQITTPAVLREVLGPLREAGVVMVGARGAVAGLGPGEALGLALRYAEQTDPDQREAQRQLVQVPTRVDDLGARITRFVTR